MKKLNSWYLMLLASLISLLGFSSCCRQKKMEKETPSRHIVPSREMRVMYGVRPVERSSVSEMNEMKSERVKRDIFEK